MANLENAFFNPASRRASPSEHVRWEFLGSYASIIAQQTFAENRSVPIASWRDLRPEVQDCSTVFSSEAGSGLRRAYSVYDLVFLAALS